MLGVTFFGLFLTPVFYVTIKWITGRFGRRGPPESGMRPILRVEPIDAGRDGGEGHMAEAAPAPV
jgi:hypothetical protein